MKDKKLGHQKDQEIQLIKSQKTDFSDILDLSVWEKTNLALTTYFTKVMTVNKVPRFFSLIDTIMLSIQSSFSSLLITDSDQWDQKSQATKIFKIFSILWEGATAYGPIASMFTGIALSTYIILVFLCIVVRAFNYGNGDRMSTLEGTSFYIVTKYFFCQLIPLLVSPIPISISEIIKGNEVPTNVICVLLCLIADYLIIYGYLNYFSVHIKFDDSQTHEWDSSTALQKVIFLNIISIILGTYSVASYKLRLGLAVLFALQQSLESCFIFFTMPYVFISGNVLFSTACATAFVGLVVHIIGFFVKIHYMVKIIIFCLIFVIYYLAMRALFYKQLEQKSAILDEFMEITNPGELKAAMEEKFRKPDDIAKLVHATFERGHPFLFQWDLFETAINLFPENGSLLLLYIRIVSIFPVLTEKLMELADRIPMTNISNPVMVKAIINALIRQRSNVFSIQLNAAIQQAECLQEHFQAATRNFWDSLESGRTEGFWNSVKVVTRARRDAVTAYAKIRENFPNSMDGLRAILDFEIDTNYNAKEARDAQEALARVYETTRAQPDPAFEAGISAFPYIPVPERLMDDSLEPTEGVAAIDDTDETILNRLETLNAMTSHPKLGGIMVMLVYITLVGAVVFALSWMFTGMFKSQTIEILQLASKTYMEVNGMMYSLSMYALQVTTLKYIRSGYLDVGHEAMQRVSKYAYKSGHIEMFDITEEDIAVTREEIRQYIVLLSSSLLNLREIESFRLLNDEMFVKNYKDKGNTMMAHISGLITQDSGDVSFFRDIIEVHNSLQELIEESAEGLDISENEKSLETLLVVIVIIITVLYMLPYSIKLFMMTTQMENLKKEFGGIAIEEFSNKDASDEDDGKHKFLHLESKDTHIFWMNISFVIGLVPIIVSLLIGYFIAVGFIETETDITKSSAYVRTSFSTARLGMIATLLQYVANDVDNNTALSKEMQELKTAFVIRSRKESQKSILLSMKEFSGWLGVEKKYIFNESELEDSYDNIPACSLMIDRLVIQNSLMAPDNMIFFLSISDPGSTYSMIWLVGELYWYNSYSAKNRDTPYFNYVLYRIYNELQQSGFIVQNMLFLIAISEIFVFISIVSVLVMLMLMLRNAVWILNTLNPVTILRNERLMSMLNEDRIREYEELQAFRGAEMVIEHSTYPIILLNRKLQVVNINQVAGQLFGVEIMGKNFQEVFDGDEGWKSFLVSLFDVPTGRCELQFTKEATIFYGERRSVVLMSVASFCNDHSANIGEAMDIQTIMITIQDISDFARLTSEIEENAKQVKRMLSNLLPSEFVADLEGGSERVAIIVQSVTIGEVKVEAERRFDFMTDEPHKLMDAVYQQFDEYMKDYETLNKCWTFAHGYTFAGGVFSTVNRPARHAEDALRFGLKLISEIPVISKKVGTNIKLTVGLHTGGPIVAGVMSVRHPQFLILGDVQRIAHEMRNTADYGVVHVSRQVYELIFSAGFTVEESQDVEVNKTTMRTYNILPL